MFENREDAGHALVEPLSAYRDDPEGLVLALPRGGVAVGAVLSRELRIPLEVFLTRKLGAPGNPEFALGAVTETGYVHMNPDAERSPGLKDFKRFLDAAVAREQEEIRRRQHLYRDGRPLPPLNDRTVILVDDGIATGATFFASVAALRRLEVRKLVAAIPVGPPETLADLRRKVDQLVVLYEPAVFLAVGNFYRDFRQVDDDEVVQYLRQQR